MISDTKIWNILATPLVWRGNEIDNYVKVSVMKYIFMKIDTGFTRWPHGFEGKDIGRSSI